MAPAVLTLAALALYPGLWVLWLSLQQRVPIFGIARFVGLDHFAFLATDPRFWNAARVTLTFAVVSVALELVVGLAVALALQRQRSAGGWRCRCCCWRGRCPRWSPPSSSSGSTTRRPAS